MSRPSPGDRNERLVVLAVYSTERGRRARCACDCGLVIEIAARSFVTGNTRSCGCLRRELVSIQKRTHGRSQNGNGAYRSWRAMKQRCTDPKFIHYDKYGGRGIEVCARWLNDFSAFLSDMGERPTGATLDRKDNNGNYTPENCRWASQTMQVRNSSRVSLEEHEPAQIRWLVSDLHYTQVEVARFFEISQAAVSRIVRGESWT